MLSAKNRIKSRNNSRIGGMIILALLFCAVGLVGHMDYEDENMKAEIIGTK